jgi:hypothetical protein
VRNGVVAASLTLATARASLELACDDLDAAVGSLSDEGDAVMANPGLIALLLRVVSARRDLKGLEVVSEAEAASDRPRNETLQ